jgi:hypothetical protein
MDCEVLIGLARAETRLAAGDPAMARLLDASVDRARLLVTAGDASQGVTAPVRTQRTPICRSSPT